MKEPVRIRTNVSPKIIQKLGNGTYYYHFDIQSEEVEVHDMEQESRIDTQYNFIQVLLRGQPNYNDCVKAIVRSYLTIDEEFDLINSYNSYTQNLTDDSSVVDKYKDYLNLLTQIKTKVKEDFSNL